jgi:type II secretory pathway predicted ATPase ExeA
VSKLKALIVKHGVSQNRVAAALGISKAAMSELVNRGRWPKRADRRAMTEELKNQLREAGASDGELRAAFSKTKTRAAKTKPAAKQEEDIMLLRRQGLFPETKRHFNLVADPFGEVQGHEDVFLSNEIRYVREALYHTARHGGFLAVIGESGSGKSTLRRDLADRIHRDGQDVHIIEPYVLAMEEHDKDGKPLKALHIAEAIMATVAPNESIKSSPEARFRQLHRVLRDSARTGCSHCLVIEEAHCIAISTLKHLKRFLELEDGFKKLMSVVLIGQPELEHKLSESNFAVREVVQRCEIVRLLPMNGSLPDYIRFRFERVGADADKIIQPDAVEALRAKLTASSSRTSANDSVSLVYPLAVGNVITAAMNLAAEIGAPMVTAENIASV